MKYYNNNKSKKFTMLHNDTDVSHNQNISNQINNKVLRENQTKLLFPS